MTKLLLAFFLLASTVEAQVIQSKACPRTPGLGIVSCTLDNPVKQGALLVATHVSGTKPSDNQKNIWQTAVTVPNFNGTWIEYALNAKPGATIVTFTANTWAAIIAEYPPSTGLDKAAFGTYTYQNAALGESNGGSSDVGYTMPIETSEGCELLVGAGVSGLYDFSVLHGKYFPSPGPGFTVRQSEYNFLGLEDGYSTIPGVYVASMNWNIYGHWSFGFAAFRMGGCK